MKHGGVGGGLAGDGEQHQVLEVLRIYPGAGGGEAELGVLPEGEEEQRDGLVVVAELH